MLKTKWYQIFFVCISYIVCLPIYAVEKSPTPTLSSVPDYSSHLGEVLITLLAIVGLIFFLAWCVKRLGYVGRQYNHDLSIKACLPLSNKEKLMVVQVGEQQVLIGVAPGGISHIIDLEQPLVTTDQSTDNSVSSISEKFSSSLNHYIKSHQANTKRTRADNITQGEK